MKQPSVESRQYGSGAGATGSEAELRARPPEARRLMTPGAALHTSVILQRLHDELPAGHFTLDWLLGELPRRSFGIIMLLLAVLAIAPGVSIVAGLLLLILGCQVLAGRAAPYIPRFVAGRQLPTRYLAPVLARAAPVLRRVERVVHPRWSRMLVPMRRLAAVVVILLCTLMVLAPIPFVSVVPALTVALIALAYLEDDGLLLALSLLAALIVLAMGSMAVWGVIDGARWLSTR